MPYHKKSASSNRRKSYSDSVKRQAVHDVRIYSVSSQFVLLLRNPPAILTSGYNSVGSERSQHGATRAEFRQVPVQITGRFETVFCLKSVVFPDRRKDVYYEERWKIGKNVRQNFVLQKMFNIFRRNVNRHKSLWLQDLHWERWDLNPRPTD